MKMGRVSMYLTQHFESLLCLMDEYFSIHKISLIPVKRFILSVLSKLFQIGLISKVMIDTVTT